VPCALFEALYSYKRQQALPSFDAALERLLERASTQSEVMEPPR
jgi:hypothetical protein